MKPAAPQRTEEHHQDGRLLYEYQVLEFERLDLDGRPYLFPLKIVGHSVGGQLLFGEKERVTTIDRASLKVNQPVDQSQFRLDHIVASNHVNADTGIQTNTKTGMVFDTNKNEIVKPAGPAPAAAVAPAGISRKMWLILVSLFTVGSFLVMVGRKLWGASSPSRVD